MPAHASRLPVNAGKTGVSPVFLPVPAEPEPAYDLQAVLLPGIRSMLLRRNDDNAVAHDFQRDPIDPNGGTGGATDSNLALGTRYTIKSNGEVNVIRPGYTFTGWNTEPDGSGISYAAGSTIDIKGDVTLYAQWDPITFDVSYEANGGTGEYNDPDIPANSQYIIKTQDQTGITNAGKTITSWNTEAAGTGTSYAPGSSTTLDKDLTLYAQWST